MGLDLELFERLVADRRKNADVLKKRSMKGVQKSVVDKYSDKAHFVYELLQNADDSCATKSRFILMRNRVLFAHNGTRLFSITDPDTEDVDEIIGDVNSITSIGSSTKEKDISTIGKFGVGFKAVFQYTSTPRIYDPGIRFMISDFVVPSLIEKDHEMRMVGETLFELPFNNAEVLPEKCYEDVKEMLDSLIYPTLFLRNLKSVEIETEEGTSKYESRVVSKEYFGDMKSERLILIKNSEIESFWKISRSYQDMEYSIVLGMNEEENLVPVTYPAFCFFSTKHETGLNFIIHAPFLLTDSRERIKATEAHNNNMIALLASLFADSLVLLRDIGIREGHRYIDDKILKIIPLKGETLSKNGSEISFYPFYDCSYKLMCNESILPASEGYADAKMAYWPISTLISDLFSDDQLTYMAGHDAKWVFKSITAANKPDYQYISTVVCQVLDENAILGIGGNSNRGVVFKGMTADFIEGQSVDWLCRLYDWLGRTNDRINRAKTRPIFLDSDGKAVAAFDKSGNEILFIPNGSSGYRFVNDDLLKDERACNLIKSMGMKEPDARDEIYSCILADYQNFKGNSTDSRVHFLRIFDYYCKSSKKDSMELLDAIGKIGFKWMVVKDSQHSDFCCTPDKLYHHSLDLVKCLPSSPFIDYEEYLQLIGHDNKQLLDEFFNGIGVSSTLRLINRTISEHEVKERKLIDQFTVIFSASECIIDGVCETIGRIQADSDADLSISLWNELRQLCMNQSEDIVSKLKGSVRYKYYQNKNQDFSSSILETLRLSPWVYGKDGGLHSPKGLHISMIDDRCFGDSRLCVLLGIREYESELDQNSDKLNDSQREAIEIMKMIESYNIDGESLRKLLESFDKARNELKDSSNSEDFQGHDGEGAVSRNDHEGVGYNHTIGRVSLRSYGGWSGFGRLSRGHRGAYIIGRKHLDYDQDEIVDSDPFIPEPVDYAKSIRIAERLNQHNIQELERKKELQDIILASKKYSYKWFKTLLEMEMMEDPFDRSREINIKFGKIELEPDSVNVLVLKHPDRAIPSFIEELSDFPIELISLQGCRRIKVEAASIRSFDLRVIISESSDLREIECENISEVNISIKSPSFLDQSLMDRWTLLGLDDGFDMKANLPSDIEFLLGPPGTGKTTRLAQRIIESVREGGRKKILVLTPTNKAADVLTERIMDLVPDHSYVGWLVRFGNTSSRRVEEEHVFRDRSFDLGPLDRMVVVTTIARYHYDHYIYFSRKRNLDGTDWTSIIIDEASMIRLMDITYVLHSAKAPSFLISGDPFQIEPIVKVDLWIGENIYSMVNLKERNSFSEPHPEPFDYSVERLITQYRSVPDIGNLFSNLTYGGLLKNERGSESINRFGKIQFSVSALNIVTFPVRNYEGIYRSKRLDGGSSYHVYSALFCVEFVKHLSEEAICDDCKDDVSIGIISPYKVQADIVRKIFERHPVSRALVRADTIHGFQGDECDIMIILLNTPPYISSSGRMFLNNRNIINVAISRARDNLFVLIPDGDTPNVGRMPVINNLVKIMESTPGCVIENSHDIEEIILGDPNYIEENTFSTSHQNVNIYGVPHKRYEVRSDDQSIDVQIVEDGSDTGGPGSFNASVRSPRSCRY